MWQNIKNCTYYLFCNAARDDKSRRRIRRRKVGWVSSFPTFIMWKKWEMWRKFVMWRKMCPIYDVFFSHFMFFCCKIVIYAVLFWNLHPIYHHISMFIPVLIQYLAIWPILFWICLMSGNMKPTRGSNKKHLLVFGFCLVTHKRLQPFS